MSGKNILLDAALAYASKGWRVFPCGINKKPLLQDWPNKASSDPAQIRTWWAEHPEASIGLACGPDSGVWVLDVDSPNTLKPNRPDGFKSILQLEEQHGPLPRTLSQSTGGGGAQIFWRWNRRDIHNSAGKIAPGIDVRGSGGYAILPPSGHPSGGVYRWENNLEPVEAPAWLLDLVCSKEKATEQPPAPPVHTGEGTPYGRKALAEELSTLSRAVEGERNDVLNRCSFSLAQLVAGGELPEDEVRTKLYDMARAIGLNYQESIKTIQSGFNEGMKSPRSGDNRQPSSGTSIEEVGSTKPLEWPDPLPLPDDLLPVKPLEPDMLPDPLRGWIMDIADRMQIPSDFSAAAAIVALGSIIGRACAVHPKRRDDWIVVPNLWGGVVGRPSLMKSPAVTEALKPLARLEAEAREEYETASRSFDLDAQVHKLNQGVLGEAIKKALKKGDDTEVERLKLQMRELHEDAPTRRRYQTQDATVEKIGELLNQNPRGILVNRDELIGFFRNLEREGREGDRAFYLEAWNGTRGFAYDRIGRGTLDVPALCISVFGTITPGPLLNYVYQAIKGGKGDDGLLQRFQVLVWPDAPAEWRNVDRVPDTDSKARVWEIFKALGEKEIPGVVTDKGSEIPTLRFSPGGQEIFDAWRDELEKRLRGDHGLHPAMESHLVKYRSLMPSLALIFHLVDVVDGAATEHVSDVAAAMAADWC